MRPDTLKELQTRTLQATLDLRSIRDERERLITAEHDTTTKRIIAEFEDRIATASEAQNTATTAYEDARVAYTLNRGWNACYPRGTKLFEWSFKQRGYSPNQKPQPTGKTAILEVFTRNSTTPGNMSPYSIPNLGDVVLRYLKKNGTPSLKVERWNDNMADSWRSTNTEKPT
jgi:hypothetical protein